MSHYVLRDQDDLQRLVESNPVLKARDEFVRRYCLEKGWPSNRDDLTMDQIMEIRSQEGWKNPV